MKVDGGPPASLDIDVAPAAPPPVLLGCGSAPLEVQEGATTSIPLVFSGGVDDFPVMKLAWSSTDVSILNGTDSLETVETPTSVVLSSPAALRRMVASRLLVYKAAKRGTHPILFKLSGLTELNGTQIRTSEATCSVRVWRRPTTTFLGEMQWSGHEDTLISVRGIVVTDADADDVSLDLKASTGRLLLAAKPAGIHVATAEGDGTWPANSTSLVLRGGVDAVNRALDGLRFEPPKISPAMRRSTCVLLMRRARLTKPPPWSNVEEVADAPQFVVGPAVDSATAPSTRGKTKPLRLGGSSHGWPVQRVAIGRWWRSRQMTSVVSTPSCPSLWIDHFTALLLRNNTWLEHGVAVIGDVRLSGTVSSLSAALADVTLIPAQDWHGPARLIKSHGVW